MAKLEKCPFCGGEAEILTAESMRGGYLFGIMCNDCCSRGDVYETEAEAIDAWNTRYHSEFEETVIKAWQEIKEYQERTCKFIEYASRHGEGYCSVCHEFLFKQDAYCPNCGAKVVE